MNNILDIVEGIENKTVYEGFLKAHNVLQRYKNIMVSVSGGSDSDLVVDICQKVKETLPDLNLHYVWFDTGIEYQATKDQLQFLENKYGIQIEREKAIKSIPYSVNHYGQPFVSKWASENIARLQNYGFKWEDEDFETLVKRYCKRADNKKRIELDAQWEQGKKPYHWKLVDGEWYTGLVCALEWWCNTKQEANGHPSRFCIAQNRWLKEFMIQNPPTFNVSAICCKYAKKDVSKMYIKEHNIDLIVLGIRKAEGGIRSTAYKTCWSINDANVDQFRPIFWYENSDKEYYEQHFDVTHSKCYTEYDMVRTGCAGCPFNMNITEELDVIYEHEPRLAQAVSSIFAESYEYTKQYRDFQKKMGIHQRTV